MADVSTLDEIIFNEFDYLQEHEGDIDDVLLSIDRLSQIGMLSDDRAIVEEKTKPVRAILKTIDKYLTVAKELKNLKGSELYQYIAKYMEWDIIKKEKKLQVLDSCMLYLLRGETYTRFGESIKRVAIEKIDEEYIQLLLDLSGILYCIEFDESKKLPWKKDFEKMKKDGSYSALDWDKYKEYSIAAGEMSDNLGKIMGGKIAAIATSGKLNLMGIEIKMPKETEKAAPYLIGLFGKKGAELKLDAYLRTLK